MASTTVETSFPRAAIERPVYGMAAFGLGGPAIFGLVDLVMLACIGYDWVKNRRLHPAFGWGFALVLLGQGGRIALSRSAAWSSFAGWLVG